MRYEAPKTRSFHDYGGIPIGTNVYPGAVDVPGPYRIGMKMATGVGSEGNPPSYNCLVCGRTFAIKIALAGHIRSHKVKQDGKNAR